MGDGLWSRFNAGKDQQLWYFGELARAFREAEAPGDMLREFERALEELRGLSGEEGRRP